MLRITPRVALAVALSTAAAVAVLPASALAAGPTQFHEHFTDSLSMTAPAASAAPEMFSDRAQFIAATAAVEHPRPTSDTVGSAIDFGEARITAPNAIPTDFGGQGTWTIAFDLPPYFFLDNPDPFVSTGLLAANGEDDYEIAFTNPVSAIGIDLQTNATAVESITVRDAEGNVLFAGSVDSLTPPGSSAFVGIKLDEPASSMFLDTTGGVVENESIGAIYTAASVVCQGRVKMHPSAPVENAPPCRGRGVRRGGEPVGM